MNFTTNLISQVARRTHNGKDYLVAPVVALVEGVVNGELALAEEFGRYPAAWNGRPITIGHPTRNGQHIPAGDLDVLAIGQIFNSEIKGDKLLAEAWLDLDALASAGDQGKDIQAKLERGQQIEISTAYFRDLQEEQGSKQGRQYVGIVRNFRPDHLAILLDEQGACSIHDGCGIPRTNADESQQVSYCHHTKCSEDDGEAFNVRTSARRPSFSGTETSSWGSVDKSLAAYLRGYVKHTSASVPDGGWPSNVAELPQAARTWIASKTLLGDAGADNGRDLVFFPVVNPSTNKLNDGALVAVLGGRGASANIPASAKDSARRVAVALRKSQFGVSTQNSKVQQVYSLLREIFTGQSSTDEEVLKMDELIKTLVANERVPFSEEELATFDEDQLKALADAFEEGEETEEQETEEQETEEESDEEEEETKGAEMPEWFAPFATRFSTVEKALGDLQTNAKTEEDKERQIIAQRIVDNKATPFSNVKEFEGFTIQQLRKLDSAYKPADYSGQGGSHSNGEITLDVELPMPIG